MTVRRRTPRAGTAGAALRPDPAAPADHHRGPGATAVSAATVAAAFAFLPAPPAEASTDDGHGAGTVCFLPCAGVPGRRRAGGNPNQLHWPVPAPPPESSLPCNEE